MTTTPVVGTLSIPAPVSRLASSVRPGIVAADDQVAEAAVLPRDDGNDLVR